jgi:hypothetical protein
MKAGSSFTKIITTQNHCQYINSGLSFRFNFCSLPLISANDDDYEDDGGPSVIKADP